MIGRLKICVRGEGVPLCKERVAPLFVFLDHLNLKIGLPQLDIHPFVKPVFLNDIFLMEDKKAAVIAFFEMAFP